MRTILLAAAATIFVAAPFAMAEPGEAAPAQVQLNQALKMEVDTGGKSNGWIVAPAGAAVAVEDVQAQQLLVDFAGARAWVPQAATDFAQRQTDLSATEQKEADAEQAAQSAKVAAYEQQSQQAAADLQGKLQDYVSPLERGPYCYTRSVVDNYDWLGRRYNIGVFGQRIYN
jgi:PDZ domain-containing secreted protein